MDEELRKLWTCTPKGTLLSSLWPNMRCLQTTKSLERDTCLPKDSENQCNLSTGILCPIGRRQSPMTRNTCCCRRNKNTRSTRKCSNSATNGEPSSSGRQWQINIVPDTSRHWNFADDYSLGGTKTNASSTGSLFSRDKCSKWISTPLHWIQDD